MGGFIKKSIIINDITYELAGLSDSNSYCEKNDKTEFFIRAYFNEESGNYHERNDREFYHIGNNLEMAEKIYDIIISNDVYPLHIKDIIQDYGY